MNADEDGSICLHLRLSVFQFYLGVQPGQTYKIGM